MKLYLYDHCPFCVRADMVAGWRKLPVARVYLLNDDVQAHLDLIGVKMAPILQFDDDRAIGESLDIVQALDRVDTGGAHLDPWDQVSAQMAGLSSVGHAINCLLFPRNVRLGLPEFATEGAIAYFTERKQDGIGMTFNQALAETPDHIDTVERMLAEMTPVDVPTAQLRMGDVLLFPTLRNLTMVQGLTWPAWAQTYVTEVAALTGVQTYTDRAI